MSLQRRLEAIERARLPRGPGLCAACRALGGELWRGLFPEHRHSGPCWTTDFAEALFRKPADDARQDRRKA